MNTSLQPSQDALKNLEQALLISQPTDLERDGTIQRFEYCYEIIWKAAKELQLSSVKTVTTKITNTDGNPCIPEGTSYNVDLKIKQASFNYETNKTVYKWETVKTINVSKDGSVMEVCAE
jgi:hypothetical protein